MEFELFEKVRIVDPRYGVDVTGWIYERHESDIPPYAYVYGVNLDRTIWAGGLCTTVWHCRGETLRPVAK
ncbi:hypothetical protein LCGC14_0741080 [marine sediment metagenome]|uniref:Uncharacterized protein n=1 Tax=marine sediment metagenome TaxID=412755 RepID=A0A0F9TDW5_9ZZZZ